MVVNPSLITCIILELYSSTHDHAFASVSKYITRLILSYLRYSYQAIL